MPNPNKKFISIYNILAKKGLVKALKGNALLLKNSIIKKEENIYKVNNENKDKDILAKI